MFPAHCSTPRSGCSGLRPDRGPNSGWFRPKFSEAAGIHLAADNVSPAFVSLVLQRCCYRASSGLNGGARPQGDRAPGLACSDQDLRHGQCGGGAG